MDHRYRGRARGRVNPKKENPPAPSSAADVPIPIDLPKVEEINLSKYDSEKSESSTDYSPTDSDNGGGSVTLSDIDDGDAEDKSAGVKADESAGVGANESAGVEGEGRRGYRRGLQLETIDVVSSKPVGSNKKGVTGRPISLVANYFELQHKQKWTLKQYRVDVVPEQDVTKVRKHLIRQHADRLKPYIFDGTMLFTWKTLAQDVMTLQSTVQETGENVQVRIRFVKDVSSGDPMSFQFYNLVIRKCLQELKLDMLGRYYYDRHQSIKLSNWQIELWPGFITSMRSCESAVLLNVEVTHKMLRMNHVLSMMKEIRGRVPEADMKRSVEEMIVGQIVMTTYNRKTYKIDSVDWDSTTLSTFPKKQKDDTTIEVPYISYYKERYNMAITAPKQPLLNSLPRQRDIHRGLTNTIKLVPELCFITGLSEEQRANFSLMRDMAQYLHMSPSNRVYSIQQFMKRIKGSEAITADMESWGIRFAQDLTNVNGRILPEEKLKFGDNAEQGFGVDWDKAFRSHKMLACATLKSWVLIASSRDMQNVDNLIRTMQKVSTPLGFAISYPDMRRIQNTQANSYVTAINEACAKYRNSLQMIFIVLPNNRIETYSAVKKRMSVSFGIPSQCFLSKNVTAKGLMSIATKVVVQMNAKLGGEPWTLACPLRNIMIVGFDVYHCGGRQGRSVGAMICTIKSTLTRYFSTVCFFNDKTELSEKIGPDFTRCIMAYKTANQGILPDRIMFYRDGVGEGQLHYVFHTELEQVKAAFKKVYQAEGRPMPKFTFIVVTKKINTRLFNNKGRDMYDNPVAGTVVDDVITLPERYDFFIVAQSVRQGTVTPCSYHVLSDDSGLTADRLQMFTFKLCHLYFNWSGTVAVPAPCQYAHKLAYLTGLALDSPVHDNLKFLLHFL